MNSEDTVREIILKFLYEHNKEKAQWLAPIVVINHLRPKGFERQLVLRNINYLADEGYIKRKSEKVKSGTIPFTLEKIIISNRGVQLFEKSKFTRKTFSTITLEGDNNIVVLGDNLGSITQTKGASISELNKFIEEVRKSTLSEEEKMSLIGDVETIKSQLVKPNPSKKVIQLVWTAINSAATFAGAHDFLLKIKDLLLGWL